MKKIFFSISFFIIINTSFYSQVNQEWVQRYNGPGNGLDEAYSIAADDSGNVYVTGQSKGIGTGYDYATIKYSASGGQQWVQRYNGPGDTDDVADAIAVDRSGNVYVTGYIYGDENGYDYATIKYNTNGVQQWVQRYNGSGYGGGEAYSIAVDGSGNVYVTGYSVGSGTGYDYATIKYNINGIQQWVQIYNGPGNGPDEANSIAVDGSGNVYVTGFSYDAETGYDYATIKYNANGVQQWVQRYNGAGNDWDVALSVAVDGSENVYITGYSTGSLTGYDYATIKYNTNGVQEWVQRYNSVLVNASDIAYSIGVDDSGNVYVTGLSYGIYYDFATIKYDASGVRQWVQRYNGPENSWDGAFSIAVDGTGNVYVTGGSHGSGTGIDYATIKYNSNGDLQWIQRYNGPNNTDDYAYSLAIDGLGNVYVTGYSEGIGTGRDYATIKYSQNIGIKPISSEVPDRYTLYQNYPNPFNPSTKIKFEIGPPLNPLLGKEGTGVVSLKIYDILGREVATIVSEQLQPGIYEVEWDGTNYPSGVYFYELIS